MFSALNSIGICQTFLSAKSKFNKTFSPIKILLGLPLPILLKSSFKFLASIFVLSSLPKSPVRLKLFNFTSTKPFGDKNFTSISSATAVIFFCSVIIPLIRKFMLLNTDFSFSLSSFNFPDIEKSLFL